MTLEKSEADYLVIGTCVSKPEEQLQLSLEPKADAKKIMVVCATDRMGYGDNEVSLKLMIKFLRTLKEMGNDLWRLVFVNNDHRWLRGA